MKKKHNKLVSTGLKRKVETLNLSRSVFRPSDITKLFTHDRGDWFTRNNQPCAIFTELSGESHFIRSSEVLDLMIPLVRQHGRRLNYFITLNDIETISTVWEAILYIVPETYDTVWLMEEVSSNGARCLGRFVGYKKEAKRVMPCVSLSVRDIRKNPTVIRQLIKDGVKWALISHNNQPVIDLRIHPIDFMDASMLKSQCKEAVGNPELHAEEIKVFTGVKRK